MILFDHFKLDNGLRVIVHNDKSTPIIAMNVLYDVGARDEHPDKTGFAHLFEHLMFGGSVNIPHYDEQLEKAGGTNNAFTSNDVTSYYLTIPKNNLETGFWLESDRMLNLAFSKKSLEVQKNVVIEEFREVYLNKPYGDDWLLLSPLAYKKHPYRWPTIGADVRHIENVTMEDTKEFYQRFYNPNNAIVTIAGPVETNEIKELCEKWFGNIPAGPSNNRKLPVEEVQTEARHLHVEREVPANSIYKAWHIPERTSKDYYISDIVSDILSNGDSSRLYVELVKKKQIFSGIDAYITGSIDPGLFIISGRLMNGISFDAAEQAINDIIKELQDNYVKERELQKVKNRIESMLVFTEIKVLEKAMNLAMFELIGDAALINNEAEQYAIVNENDILSFSQKYLTENNCSTLYYHAKKTE
ncbi:MAG: pitrilysin family protein [Bacteroidales bacterium]